MRLENVDDIYPLSPAQQGMLFHDLLAPGSGVYYVQLSFTIRGNLDIAAFRRAWQAVLDRHAVLRTAFAWEGLDQPLQIVRKQVELPWRFQQWTSGGAECDSRIDESLRADRLAGFDLSRAPLMSVMLVQIADDEWRCVWSHHHLILDGWSAGLVLQDVLSCYVAMVAGREPTWRPCRAFREYIAWLQRQDLDRADTFWHDMLSGITAPTPLGIDRPIRTDAVNESHHGEQQLALDEAQTASLQTFARKHQVTLNTLVTGALAICLGRYTGQSEVLFGVTVAGRPTDLPGADAMVGMFINTLPLRVAVPGTRCVVDWLRDLQARQASMMPFAATPLVRIQGQAAIPAGRPLFESILVFENYPVDESLSHAPAGLSIDAPRGMEQTNYPLAIYAVPGPRLTLRVAHDRRRIDDAAAARMLRHLHRILKSFIADPQGRLADVAMLGESERHEILCGFNNTACEVPSNVVVHNLFEMQCERTPQAVAAICGDERCTYAELNARAEAIAGRLRALGIQSEDRVGICLHRSIDMLAAVLGVLKAGAAYVPLDPAFPSQRLAMMIEDAEPRAIVTQHELTEALPPCAASRLLVSDAAGCSHVAIDPYARKAGRTGDPARAAYVIFTSGSTGRPKGVVIEHRAVVNFLTSMARQPSLNASDTLIAVTTLSFDIAGLELLLPLSVGARVVIAAAEEAADPFRLQELLNLHGATVMQATPATWRMLLESGWPGREGLRVLCGGEPLGRDLADALLNRSAELWNLYGPTETTIWSSVQRIAVDDQPVSIGRPIANTSIYILDDSLEPVPIGVIGELYIAGSGVARGYLNRADLSAERFVPDPFCRTAGARMYRTGDLARHRSDGTIECLGRVDHQVKIRGFRIELGEIESAMQMHPSVRQAVVVDREDAPGDKRLVAYWIGADDEQIDVGELRRQLHERLPDYMIPAAFVRLDALPLTPNGKLDRRALPAPDTDRHELGESYIAPRDHEERTLAAIWSQLLSRSTIGAHDNFFELGGHSLLATRLVSKIREAMAVSLPLRTVFDAPTLASLAERIRAASPTEGTSTAIAAEVEEGRI